MKVRTVNCADLVMVVALHGIGFVTLNMKDSVVKY
jgi:hypothetical protein